MALNRFDQYFEELRARVYGVYSLNIDCTHCPVDGREYTVQIRLNTGLSDIIKVRLIGVQQPMAKTLRWWQQIPLWAYISGGALMIVGIALITVLINRNRKRKQAALEAERQRALEIEKAREMEAMETLEAIRVMDVTGESRGLKIRFDKIGTYERDVKYHTQVVNNLVLGRSGSDITIGGDEQISRKHCQIVYENGNLMLIDLNSANGTYLNGVPIKAPTVLKSGDIIMLGRTELRITFDER